MNIIQIEDDYTGYWTEQYGIVINLLQKYNITYTIRGVDDI